MGPLAARAGELALRGKRRVKRCMLCFFTLVLFLNVGVYFQMVRMWPVYGIDAHCEHPPLPANRSGLKVLVAAFAKMGTRTMSRTLHDLGLEHSYHSEELALHIWSRVAVDFWARDENKATKVPLGMPYVGRTEYDLQVLGGTSRADLAAAVSRCRADALAFDAMEELFWPMYEVSPNAKVVVLNWRSFDEVTESALGFNPWFTQFTYVNVYLSSAFMALPWGLAFYALDPILGRPVLGTLAAGGPPVNQAQGPLMMLWYRMAAPYRVTHHWFHGLGPKTNSSYFGFLPDKAMHGAFFERIYREVPPERRMDFDPRKHTFEELCSFLGMTDCKRSGLVPRAKSVYSHERDFPLSFCICAAVYLILHWINWNIFSWLIRAFLSVVARPTAG